MNQINRREALALGSAAVAAAALPAPVIAAAEIVAAPPLPVWLVGTPGEYDWNAYRAATEIEARIQWACDLIGDDNCECEPGKPPSEECRCEFCENVFAPDAERKPMLDAVKLITPADWIRADMGHVCSRCSNETSHEDGYAVGDEAVCIECMELPDWDIANPERAAEIRADMAEEGA